MFCKPASTYYQLVLSEKRTYTYNPLPVPAAPRKRVSIKALSRLIGQAEVRSVCFAKRSTLNAF